MIAQEFFGTPRPSDQQLADEVRRNFLNTVRAIARAQTAQLTIDIDYERLTEILFEADVGATDTPFTISRVL